MSKLKISTIVDEDIRSVYGVKEYEDGTIIPWSKLKDDPSQGTEKYFAGGRWLTRVKGLERVNGAWNEIKFKDS